MMGCRTTAQYTGDYRPLLESLHVFASGWKTARVDVLLFEYGGWVGWDINVHVSCVHTWMLRRCCYLSGVGWGGVGY